MIKYFSKNVDLDVENLPNHEVVIDLSLFKSVHQNPYMSKLQAFLEGGGYPSRIDICKSILQTDAIEKINNHLQESGYSDMLAYGNDDEGGEFPSWEFKFNTETREVYETHTGIEKYRLILKAKFVEEETAVFFRFHVINWLEELGIKE